MEEFDILRARKRSSLRIATALTRRIATVNGVSGLHAHWDWDWDLGLQIMRTGVAADRRIGRRGRRGVPF